MSFGYNGKLLGVAFTNFHLGPDGLYVALSMNLENECRFNFGQVDEYDCSYRFVYQPPPDFKPLAMLADEEK